MTDVDAIRWMASEHDLEFVDLDTYGVDPAAGDILPGDLARQLGMVAIKRKFGTPVIATSDPDDLYAQDSVRAAIGRDFISVVASPEQITWYLDQIYGPIPVLPTEEEALVDRVVPGDLGERFDPSIDSDEVATPDDAWSGDLTPSVLDSLSLLAPDTDGSDLEADGYSDGGATSAMYEPPAGTAPTSLDDLDDLVESPVDEGDLSGSSGKGRRGKEEKKRQKADAERGLTEPLDDMAAAESVASDESDFESPVPIKAEAVDLGDQAVPTFEAIPDRAHAASDDRIDTPEPLDTSTVEFERLEPATSVLPSFGSDWNPPPVVSPPNPLAASVDQLAELARSLQETPASDLDNASAAADLVAEAVATYQEQQGDEQGFEPAPFAPPSPTSMFPPLAKALVDGDRVSLEDMERVLEEHYRTETSIARLLTAQKLVTEADLMWGMAQEMGLEFVDLDTIGIDYVEIGTIPESTARHHNVLVIANDHGTPVVAASNPTDVFAMDDLRTIMGRNFRVVVATRSQISFYIGKAFNSGGDAGEMAKEASIGLEGQNSSGGVEDIQSITEEAPIVRYVNLLILQALNERASDVHIEPTEKDLRIRYRIDGVLHEASTAPRSIAPAVTTRLKVMADMNIAEHRIPQDGRISLNVGAKGIDLRMATLPTIYGEKIVMRVLDKASVVLGFADLGFDDDLLRTYEGLYTKPYGTILVTGPTGSGKSTTLYTTLTALNSPEKNIITVEDPVELPLKGVNQVQLNQKAGLNFAEALRAILRSDPDIVLVGEVRDKETAVIAIEAALTGHMVLSTLHTNNAASTPMRLIEMGLEPFLVTSAVSGVLAQRLARRLCVHCKEAFEPTEADITSSGWKMSEVDVVGGLPKLYRAVGCSACANTGYRGRKALAELMPMTEEIERSIIEGGSMEEIHRIAVAQGMTTLRQSGLRKAIEGETTLEEVLRVVA
jgi:type IV pilus assembly protein PilB